MFQRSTIRQLTAIVVLCVVLMSGVAVGVLIVQAQDGTASRLSSLPAAPAYQPNGEEGGAADLYALVTPSVVNISVVQRVGAGTGTGFVIDNEGHIVTNNHVIENATYIEVTFVDGTIAEATLVGTDPDSDLAVVKIDPSGKGLKPLSFADSDNVFVGQQVFAIGSPFGQDFTLTSGIVSALKRSLRNDNSFSNPELIQTDAAINPGNSGGPLMNWDGNVIGVNVAILSGTGSNSGVGFAIPANTVRRVVPYLLEKGTYEHSWLGISGLTLRPEQRTALELSSDVAGVMVTDVTRGGPAAGAGLRGAESEIQSPVGRLPVGGDIITAVNGDAVPTMDDLISYLDTTTLPGDTITLSVWRDGQNIELPVTLQPRP